MSARHRYAVDLVTFYHPSFWGVRDYSEIIALRDKDPEHIWTRILDSLADAGITGLEMTFPPADARSVREAFGSAAQFRADLRARGLRLVSGFHMGTDWVPGADIGRQVADAEEYAAFLSEAGAEAIVVGLPMRTSWNAKPPAFVDIPLVQSIADVAHRVGYAAEQLGVRLALHTEAHSVLSTARDIDLFMAATDPEYVNLCPDSAHIALSGSDPVDVISRHRERVIIAHWKDTIGAMPRVPIDPETIHDRHREYWCALGEGVVAWQAWSDIYATTPAAHIRMIEIDAVPDPVHHMKAGKAFLQSLS